MAKSGEVGPGGRVRRVRAVREVNERDARQRKRTDVSMRMGGCTARQGVKPQVCRARMREMSGRRRVVYRRANEARGLVGPSSERQLQLESDQDAGWRWAEEGALWPDGKMHLRRG